MGKQGVSGQSCEWLVISKKFEEKGIEIDQKGLEALQSQRASEVERDLHVLG